MAMYKVATYYVAGLLLRPLACSTVAVGIAVTGVAGCSSSTSTPTASPKLPKHVTGTMGQWTAAVCTSQLFPRGGKVMPNADGGGECEAGDSTYRAPIVFGTYPRGTESSIDQDVAMYGPYAEGDDGSQDIVFSTFMGFNHRVLIPLEQFGFVLHPGRMSACYGKISGQRVECPAPGDPTRVPLPGNGATREPSSEAEPSSTAAATAPPPSASDTESFVWQLPSGNIACKVGPSSGAGYAICDVVDHTFSPSCPPGSGARVAMQQGQPPTFVGCRSDTYATGQHVGMMYGFSWRSGAITCDSETSGVTCTDASTHHFFHLAREDYQIG
jgi:hypothetical protein